MVGALISVKTNLPFLYLILKLLLHKLLCQHPGILIQITMIDTMNQTGCN